MNAYIQSFAVLLTDAAILSTIVLALGIAASYMRTSAAVRHGLLAMSIACLPLLAATMHWMPQWSLKRSAPSMESAWKINVRFGGSAEVTEVAPMPVQHIQPAAWGLSEWCLVVWSAGFGLGILRLVSSAWRLSRLKRRSVLVQTINGVEVRRSTESVMPMTWGIVKVFILLPTESVHWNCSRMELVLKHEMAHIQRHDALCHLWCSLAAWLCWFQPLVWVAMMRLTRLREIACDDLAVPANASPVQYAEDLLAAVADLQVKHLGGLGLAIGMAEPATERMKERLKHILDATAPRGTFNKRTWVASVLSFVIGTIAISGLCISRQVFSAEVTKAKALEDGSQVYFLSDAKYKALAGEEALDPFGDKLPQPPPPTAEQLKGIAVRVRSRLLDEGIMFQTNEQGEALVMTDSRAMKGWADEDNHKKLAALLGQGGRLKMVLIQTKAFEVPLDHELMKTLTGGGDAKRFDMRGTLTAEQGADLLTKMSASNDITLCSAPSVTTHAGVRATVEVVREFWYPVEYDPPHADQGKLIPATPTTFAMRPIGLRMEFEPRVDAAGGIDLDMAPEITEFEGFVNYGGPDNRVTQPVFRSMKLKTSASMQDGSFVIMGGLGQSGDHKPTPQPGAIDGKEVDPSKLPDWKAAKKAMFFLVQARVVD